MAGTRVSVQFNDVNDARLYLPGHLVNRWSHEVRRDLHFAIKEAAPVNKRHNKSNNPLTFGGPATPVGWLKQNIVASGVDHVNARGLVFGIISKAGYTQAVLKGTKGGRIRNRDDSRFRRNAAGQFARKQGLFGPKSTYYRLPFNGPGRGALVVLEFSGQRPNNFFERGFFVAAAKHPSLR